MRLSRNVIVLGSINTDLVVRGDRLPRPGETVLGGEFYQSPGGKGANQAVAAARCSTSIVRFVAAVGDDALGSVALAGLRRENLDCSDIRTVAGQASGVALILVDRAGQNLISVASGANACVSAADLDRISEGDFSGPGVFLASLEVPVETVAYGLARARRAGRTTILNPAPADRRILAGDLPALIDVLTPNETEAALLAGDEPRAGSVDASRVEGWALELKRRGCGAVVVTLGAAGCLVVAEKTTLLPAHPVEAVDATAAGDAFSGALAVALAEGQALLEGAKFASAAAALSVTRRGAQPSLPCRTEIEDFLARAGGPADHPFRNRK